PAHPGAAAHGQAPARPAAPPLLRRLRRRPLRHRAAARRRPLPRHPLRGPLMTNPTPVATTTDAAAPGSRRGVVLDMTLLIALVAATTVVAESIGVRSVPLTGSITITVLPLVFAVVLTMVLGIPAWRKGILRRVYSPRTIGFSGAFLIVIMLPL